MRHSLCQVPFATVVLIAASVCGLAASACSAAAVPAHVGATTSTDPDGAPSDANDASDGGARTNAGAPPPSTADAGDTDAPDAEAFDARPGSPSDGEAGDSASAQGDAASGPSIMMEVTAYGWDDNSPPGDAIAYPANGGFPTLHNVASGTGTHADPITFATDMSEYPPGTILYVPFLEKYVIMEDDCTQCDTDWTSSTTRHIDVWMNSNGTESPNALFDCEDTWTRSSTTVVTAPSPNLPVTTAPLFDPSTNTCRTTP
jgi:3D (Asp-Asp-Asp) domain-containing protein